VSLGDGPEEGGSSAEEGVVEVLKLPRKVKTPLSLYVRSDVAFLGRLATQKMPSPGLEPALAAHRLADLAYHSAALANAQH
jgi:hypothetical protein